MLRYGKFLLAASAATIVATSSLVSAHDSGNDGHVPANVNYGFNVIGQDVLAGVQDGRYTDVWSHNGYAYVGTFQEPDCSRAGVYIADIAATIANYPNTTGAMVNHIPSAPNTRVNDVKVHRVGNKDVLIASQEPCGGAIPGARQSDNPPSQLGQGGISLYDVTDPLKPKALKKNFMEWGGVHNTFPFDWNGRSYLLGTADTFDFFDTFVVDITKPQSPTLLTVTGALDWIPQGVNLDQLETGSSAGIFNHDVWVDMVDGVPHGVVSYWDLGFVTLDLSDPANPVFLSDSTYPSPEPIVGEPYEGNAHAAVFGGDNGQYLFAGDEDFSDSSFAVLYDGVAYAAGQALFGPASATLSGSELVYVGGTGCTVADIPSSTGSGQVALIDRGVCFFQDKADAAAAQGYVGFVIVNNQGDGLLNMAARDSFPTSIPGVFVGTSSGAAMKANLGLPISASSVFDGWGYLHIINNSGANITVPDKGMSGGTTMDVPHGFELGYYAPAEAVEPLDPAGAPYGDLTMHNVEADPLTRDVVPTMDAGPRMFISWYSLGMRAVEYRPGHYHTNANGEGSYSQNVHEVGRYIADEGSNFWGVHVDELDDGTQIILGSDRNSGLWIFTFSCETKTASGTGSIYYCDPNSDGSGE